MLGSRRGLCSFRRAERVGRAAGTRARAEEGLTRVVRHLAAAAASMESRQSQTFSETLG